MPLFSVSLFDGGTGEGMTERLLFVGGNTAAVDDSILIHTVLIMNLDKGI